jgi:hypothetical protein
MTVLFIFAIVAIAVGLLGLSLSRVERKARRSSSFR